MTLDEPGQWMTLSQAALKSGYSREALRQRVRRGRLPATKGNDGVLRIAERDLADLQPLDDAADPGHDLDVSADVALDALAATVADLRSSLSKATDDLERTRLTLDKTLDDLGRTRLTVDKAHTDSLAAHGRAERAEATLAAQAANLTATESRLAAADAALAEARTPWIVRVARAMRG